MRSPNNSKKPSFSKYRQLLGTYLGPQKGQVILLGVLILVNLGLQLLIPQIIGDFIDSVTAGVPLTNLVRLGLIFFITALLQQIFEIFSTYYTQNVAWRATNALREDLARHTLSLDMSFHKAHPPGEMISRIDSDINTLNDFFSQFLLRLAGNFLLVIAILVLLFREDWRIGLVLMGFSLIAMLVLVRFRNVAVPHWEAEREAEADFFSFLEERLAGTTDIRANGGRPFTLRQFFAKIQVLYQRSIKAGLMVNIMLNSMLLIFVLGTAASLGVSGALYFQGVLTIGTVYIVFQYNRMLEGPLEDISRQLSNVQKSMASIHRVMEIFETKSRIKMLTKIDQGPNLFEGRSLALQFDHVSFHYEDQAHEEAETDNLQTKTEHVLWDIDFFLGSGEVLGLLGRTGSGKTTLTRLLFRLYDPQTGSIKLSSQAYGGKANNISKLPLAKLRDQIGMVTQNIELFHATVRDNLTFFDTTISDKKIIDVIYALGLSQWFSGLSKGLDTMLKSGGAGLSAGEAQLLAFVRIFLKNPAIVILDEASSRLDPATEQLIEKAVDKLIAGRTALIIAHRLKTVERADKIMILQDGRVIEFGDRKTLALDPHSRFSQLLQAGIEDVLA